METEIVKIHHKAEESHASLKKRNVVQRSIVAVKVETNDKKQKSDGPPSDSWSWRKYGQKPIKGTPYPRGYYKCSTSKGCTAKKQVERSKTDSSMLIITYTSTHNHPGPDLPIPEENPKTPNQEEESKKEQQKTLEDEADLHYSQSPFHHSQDIITTNQEVINCTNEKLDLVPTVAFDENPPNSSHPDQTMNVAKCKADENDFFNELDELPSTSSFTELLRSNLVEGRALRSPFE